MADITGTAVLPNGQVLRGGRLVFEREPSTVVAFGGDTVMPNRVLVDVGDAGEIAFSLIEGRYSAGFGAVQFPFTVTDAADMQFNEGLGAPPQPDSPPVITQQPSITPSSPVAGQTVTINWGAATGTPAPTQDRVFLFDGSDASSQLTGNQFVAQEGQYVVDGAWSNGVGAPVPVVPVSFVVDAAPAPEIDYDTMAIAYFNAENAITGTDSDVLTMTARGTGNVVYTKAGTGAVITRTADGFVFADGTYLQSQPLTDQPTTDGMFAVVSFTIDSYGASQGILLDGTGGHIKIRNNNGNLQFLAQDDTADSMAMGGVVYGNRMTVAGEIDDVIDIMRVFNATGSLITDTDPHPGMTDPSLGRLIHGRYIIGTIHEFAIVGKPEGGEWPVTMEAVFADFTRGA